MEVNMEGKILSIMESWPLQLTVESKLGEIYHVQLHEEALISKGDSVKKAGDLSINLEVKVKGDSTGLNSLLAREIHILK